MMPVALFHEFQVVGTHLAAFAVRQKIEGQFLALTQFADAGSLDGADMHEGVVAALVRRNKAEALLGVKPFHGSHRHAETLSYEIYAPAVARDVEIAFFRKEDVCMALIGSAEGGVVRPSIDTF